MNMPISKIQKMIMMMFVWYELVGIGISWGIEGFTILFNTILRELINL